MRERETREERREGVDDAIRRRGERELAVGSRSLSPSGVAGEQGRTGEAAGAGGRQQERQERRQQVRQAKRGGSKQTFPRSSRYDDDDAEAEAEGAPPHALLEARD